MPTVAQRLEREYLNVTKLRWRINQEILKMAPGPATDPVKQGLREVDRLFSQGEEALLVVLKGIDKTLGFGGPP